MASLVCNSHLDCDLSKGKPVYVNYEKLFSKAALRREEAYLRKIAHYMLSPDYIKMGGGFPNDEMFPILEADFKLKDGSVVHVDQDLMATHMQYGLSQGYPDLREWMIEFQRRIHSPPTFQAANHPGLFDLLIVNGGNNSISMTFQLLMDEGDWLLVEDANYSTMLDMLPPIGASAYPIKGDAEGMLTEDLDTVLTSWNDLHPGAPKPKLIYVDPSGGNPTGITWSLARKREIYKLARVHNLIILEDEAYFFLQFNRPLIPSFLSIDTDGRVVRMDTFSKVVAPGLRVAVLSGPKPIMYKLRLYKDVNSFSCSGLTQAMLAQLLRHWGHDGFLRHVDSVMEFYKRKAETVVRCAEKHLSGLAEWQPPSGGMFLWVKVLGVKDAEMVTERLLQDYVVMIPGRVFTPTNEKDAYIRISFGVTSQDDCEKAFSRLAKAIRASQTAEK